MLVCLARMWFNVVETTVVVEQINYTLTTPNPQVLSDAFLPG